MARNPLSPDAIVQAMAEALPTHPAGDATSDLSGSYEALALFTHACMACLDFRLIGLTEGQKRAGDDDNNECRRLAPRLPPGWNASFNSYSFVYAHAQSAMTFVTKVDRMGQRAEVRGIASATDAVVRFDVAPRDYVSSAALPVRITLGKKSTPAGGGGGGGGGSGDATTTTTTTDSNNGSTDDGGGGGEDRTDLPAKLGAVFVSPERIADLASLVKVSIVQRLAPGIAKDGYAEERDPDDRAAEDDARRPLREAGPQNPRPDRRPSHQPPHMPDPARPYPHDDPLAVPPRPPGPVADFPPPDFDDELDINRPHAGRVPLPGPLGPFGPAAGRSPFAIGHDDLHPPGLGHPFLAGGGGLARPAPGGGGGMHPTFDDPLFGGRGGGGGDGMFDPQVPPGARYDPVGPGGGIGPFGGGGGGPFGRRGGGGRGGGGSPFGGGGFGGGIL
ncbi:hypothetical protein RB598_000672 [Gaeumannomyces tritici]